MPFDPDQFRRRYPGRAFPELRFCSERQRWDADRQLAAALHPSSAPSENVLWELFDRAAPLAVQSPDLGRLLALCELPANAELYVDWYLGDQARVTSRDLLDSFDAYWEAGADDVAVFDDSFEWVLYFTRDGGVRLLRAGESPAGDASDVPPDP
jgi:hypothetical protein